METAENRHNELQPLLTRFLLGQATARERRAVELKLLKETFWQTALQEAEYDLVDDYLRAALSDEQAHCFELYFLRTPARRQQLRAARALHCLNAQPQPAPVALPVKTTRDRLSLASSATAKYQASRQSPTPLRRVVPRSWTLLAASFAVIVLGFALWRAIAPTGAPTQTATLSTADWQALSGQWRAVEGRLSGQPYLNFDALRGVESQPSRSDERELAIEETKLTLIKAVREHPGAAARHALGRFYLLQRNFKDAAAQLGFAQQAEPTNPQILNDLGLALLEQGRQDPEPGQRFTVLSQALERFDEAFRLNDQLLESLFNRALCVQAMGPDSAAVRAWQGYLQRDGQSQWANEARAKLAEIEKRQPRAALQESAAVQTFVAAAQAGDDARMWETFRLGRRQTGNLMTEALLDDYLNLTASGNRIEAARRLDWLSEMAEWEARPEHGAETFTQQLAEHYRRAGDRQLDRLRQARHIFKQARERNKVSKQEARALYAQARGLFAQARSDADLALTDWLMLAIEMLERDHQEGQARAERLTLFAEQRRMRWIKGYAVWAQGAIANDANEFARSQKYFQQALDLGVALQDETLQLRSLLSLTSLHTQLGSAEPPRYLAEALACLARFPFEPQRRWETAAEVLTVSMAHGRWHTARVYGEELLHLANEMKRPLHQSRTYRWLAQIAAQQQDSAAAQRFGEAALAVGISLQPTDAKLAQDIEFDARLQLGQLFAAQGATAVAASQLDRCFGLLGNAPLVYQQFAAHRARGAIQLALPDYNAAEKDWLEALRIFENSRATILDQSQQKNYLADSGDIYDQLTEFYAERRGGAAKAFLYAERSHARSLLEEMAGQPPPTELDLAQIQNQLPADVQLLQYAVLPQSVRMWVITRAGFFEASSPIDAADLQKQIEAFVLALSQPAVAEWQPQAEKLYDILIAPVAQELQPQAELCLLPDKALHLLPFAALRDAAAGRLLIEKQTLLYAPSVAVFLRATTASQSRSQAGPESCLSVGDPAFDEQRWRALPRLPAAGSESVSVAQFYAPSARHLRDAAASEAAVRREMPLRQVLHFAVHGQVNAQKSGQSNLVLARAATQLASADNPLTDGLLTADEVAALRLRRARLVVLSACQTRLGRLYRGEGVDGLTHAFLSAGAPLVVSSLWSVSSNATNELMRNFHRLRAQQKLRTTQALQQAQLAFLNHPNAAYRHPSAWAAFVPIGASASY